MPLNRKFSAQSPISAMDGGGSGRLVGTEIHGFYTLEGTVQITEEFTFFYIIRSFSSNFLFFVYLIFLTLSVKVC